MNADEPLPDDEKSASPSPEQERNQRYAGLMRINDALRDVPDDGCTEWSCPYHGKRNRERDKEKS